MQLDGDGRQMSALEMFNLTGASIIVTGATGVLCRRIVQALVECGANVGMVTRSTEKGDDLLRSLVGPGRAIVLHGDVLQRDDLLKIAAEMIREFGRIDGLVNGAGGNSPQATTRPDQPFFDLPEEALRFVIDLNLLGTLLPTQILGKYLAEQRQGVILNVSSMSSFRPLTRVVGYSAAKAALNNFTQWLAVHLAQEYSPRLRVNAIAPGFFLTEQNRFLLTDKDTGELTPRGQSIVSHTPMERFGQPDDLLGAALWLLSPASAFVTGIVVPIDGGFSAFSGV